ncbi:hypothetical protein OZX58_01480 [Lactobacillus sp. ESL0680]|uniref:hypothetical protein n=1 Tax=Lactobacillus sp. ESL0680 TaxID=2983210 RepID=UPI0023F8E85A|nr:hypothetical protein [Lactobacillus sp. ESL0680]WEV38969.1 hypothetical protein OZX58_01480 [Lactobacillus sp. ESL0680]
MKFKKILTSIIASLGLIAGSGMIISTANNSVYAATITHTIPQKFRGVWYQKGYDGMYYIENYRANSEAYYDTNTRKQDVYFEPVSVKKISSNKCKVWSASEKNYKTTLTLKHITYNGKNYKMLAVKKGNNPALYYFNHKINRFYSAKRGFIK